MTNWKPKVERVVSNQWEQVTESDATHRMMVPGGWLVRTFATNVVMGQQPSGIIGGESTPAPQLIVTGVAVTFVPDPEHLWDVRQFDGVDA